MLTPEKEKLHQYVFVHPFNDPHVIAGQGTIGMEILRQHQHSLDAVFVPVGGGGLISGVAAYIKAVRPQIKIIGVQTADSDAMIQSVKAGKIVSLTEVGLFSDGTAVKTVGDETFRLTRELVDDFVIVDTDGICAAIKDAFEDTRSILGTGRAMSIAGMKQYIEQHDLQDKELVAITSGANMNFARLGVAERAEAGEGREALLAVTIPEQRGSFKRLCQAVGERNVTEFSYRMSDEREAHVLVGLTIEIAPMFRRSAFFSDARFRRVGFGKRRTLKGALAIHGRRKIPTGWKRTNLPRRVSRTPRGPDAVSVVHAPKLEY